jgi:iron complex outermembrane receptor protein
MNKGGPDVMLSGVEAVEGTMSKRIIVILIILYVYVFNVYPQTADSSITLGAVRVEAYQVSSQLRTIPGSISVLTSADINYSDGNNLSDVLNTLPGVTMQTGTYTTNRIVIRGMGSRTPYNTNRIKAYLNDIPITTSDGLSSTEEIDGLTMGRMELIKGPSSAIYGSGLGGSLNLYTPSKISNSGRLLVQYGSYNTWKAHGSFGISKNNAKVWSAISHLHSAGYRENNSYDRSSVMVTADFIRKRLNMDYLLLVSAANAGIPSSIGETLFEKDPRAAAPNWKAINGYKKFVRGIAGITLTVKLSENVTNKFIMFGRGNDSYEKRPFNNLDDRSLGMGIRNKLSIHNSRTDWVLGTEWIFEEYAWELDTTRVVINRNRENRRQINVFAIAYYRPGPKINLSFAGAVNSIKYRLTDLYSGNGLNQGTRKFPVILSPRIGINYSPGSRFALYASAGQGFSLPSPEETLLPAGEINPGIKHEEGWQFEAGSRLNLFRNRMGMDITWYWIELNNLLVTKRITEDIFTGINAGKSRHQGIELTSRFQLTDMRNFPGKMSADVSFTRSWNSFLEFSDDGMVFDGNALPGIPDKVFYVKMDWNPVGKLDMMMDLRYTGSQYLDDGNTRKYDGHWVGNMKLAAAFKIGKTASLSVYGGINNITDTAYASMLIINAQGFNNSEPRYYYPGLARHGYAGLQFSF